MTSHSLPHTAPDATPHAVLPQSPFSQSPFYSSLTRRGLARLIGSGLVVAAGLLAGCDKGTPTKSETKSEAKTETTAAGTAETPAGEIRLGFVVKQPEEPWFQLEWKFAEAEAGRLGFKLIKLGASDGDRALAAIDNLASQQAQGFVICTPDVTLGPALTKAAEQRKLKMITVDDQLLGSDGKPMTQVPYVGISARKIGNQVGDALLAEMKKRGWDAADTAVCVVTFDELDTARERTEGATESLVAGGFAKDKMYKAPQKTSDVPGALDAVTVLLTQHPEVKRWLICGMNDSAVIGAVRATEGRGIPAENVIGIGINGTDCISEFEKAKPTGFFASVLLSARKHGAMTTDMLYDWVKDGKDPAKDTRTTGELINRETYKGVLKDQGILQ